MVRVGLVHLPFVVQVFLHYMQVHVTLACEAVEVQERVRGAGRVGGNKRTRNPVLILFVYRPKHHALVKNE